MISLIEFEPIRSPAWPDCDLPVFRVIQNDNLDGFIMETDDKTYYYAPKGLRPDENTEYFDTAEAVQMDLIEKL